MPKVFTRIFSVALLLIMVACSETTAPTVSEVVIGVGSNESNNLSELPADSSTQLIAVVRGNNNPSSLVTWESQDTSVITLAPSSGAETTLRAVSAGTTTVTATSVLDPTKSSQVTVTVKEVVVVLGADTVNLKIGEKTNVSGLVLGAIDQTLLWESKNASIATVNDDGEVVGLRSGQTYLTARSAVDEDAMDQVLITVSPVKVDLNTSNVTLDVGDSLQLEADVEGVDDIVWSSSDPGVVTVNATGLIEAKKTGVADITVKSASNPAVQAVSRVTVSPVIMTVDPSVLPAFRPGDSLSLKTTITGAKDTSVRYSSTNASVLSIDANGKLTAANTGDAVISIISNADPLIRKTLTAKVAAPQLAINQTRFSFDAFSDQVVPKSIRLSNDGNAPLEFSVSATESWLASTVANGVVPAGGNLTVTFEVNTSKLSLGRHQAQLTIQGDNGNIRQDINVTVFVIDGESNDIRANATPLKFDFYSPQLQISKGDVDWYTFTLDAAATVIADINANAKGSTLDALLGLTDDAGNLIAINDDFNGFKDPQLTQVLKAGTYYLAVSALPDSDLSGNHDQRGFYFLNLSKQAAPDMLVEPGTITTTVAKNDTRSVTFNIINTGASDLEFSVQADTPESAPRLIAQATNTKLVVGADWAKTFKRTSSTKAPPVTSSKASSPLVINKLIADPIGDTLATGPDVVAVNAEVLDDSFTLEIIMTNGTFDSANFAGVVEIDLDQNPETNSRNIGAAIACPEQDIGAERFFSFDTDTGSFNVLDENFSGISSYPLELTANSIRGTVPLSDLRNDRVFNLVVTAGTLSTPTDCAPNEGTATVATVALPLTITPSQGTIAAGESAEITIDINGDELELNDTLRRVLTVTSNAVRTPEAQVILNVTSVLQPDKNEPNDTLQDATSIALDYSSASLSLTKGDVDWFVFTLDSAERIEIDMDAATIGSSIDGLLGLFDSNGVQIDFNDDNDSLSDPRIDTGSKLSKGTYYVAVSGYPDDAFEGAHTDNDVYALTIRTVQ